MELVVEASWIEDETAIGRNLWELLRAVCERKMRSRQPARCRRYKFLRRVLMEGQASGVLVNDAEIAALTIEYGGVLYTADRDFTRFPGLPCVNPLSA